MATDNGEKSRKKPKLEAGTSGNPPDAATPAAAPAADKDQLVSIAPDGDIVLLVGPEKRALKVHSLLLKMALRPLAAKIDEALYGPWAAPEKLPTVALPDDDPLGFTVVCGVLHNPGAGRSGAHAGPVRGDVLLAVARTACKYECAERIFFTTDYWLRRAFTVADPSDNAASWKFLMAACLLSNEEWFYHFSNRLCIFYKDSFLAFAQDARGPEHVLALRLSLALEEKRSRDRSACYRAPTTLCIECFKAATASFHPSQTCNKCTAIAPICPAPVVAAPAPAVDGVQRAPAPVMSFLDFRPYGPAPGAQRSLRPPAVAPPASFIVPPSGFQGVHAPAPGQHAPAGRPIAPAPTVQGVQGTQGTASPRPPVGSGQITAPAPAPNDAK